MADQQALNIIVIGAGFGGLAAAIELASRGATVRVFEVYKDTKKQGDVIQMPANGTRLIAKWGNVLERISANSACPDTMAIVNKDGKLLLNQQLHREFNGFNNLYCHRGQVQLAMLEHALALGVKVDFATPVTQIFETPDSVGVVVAAGEKHEADAVIGADGVHSKSRHHVLGTSDRPLKSGFAVYRSWFPLDSLRDDPVTREIADSPKDLFKVWIAEDTHAILTTNKALNAVTCFVTHKDLSDIAEDWHVRGDNKDMLACVQDWDVQLRHIIEKIPRDCLIDHKLLWRDPVPKWVSDGGRICLLGDAAHPHLATSGTGAAQAIEDAATIAALLDKMGDKKDIPLAFRAYQKLRYERTSLTQRMGWETRHVWHQTDWEAVAANPDILKLPQPEWLLGSDATKYVEDNYEAIISHIQNGTPFSSTNIPPGHVHKDWTVKEMLAYEGKSVEKDFFQTRD